MSLSVSGYLEKHSKGFGFLRKLENGLKQSPEDTFIPAGTINRFAMEDGVFVEGIAEENPGKPAPALKEVTMLNGVKAMDFRFRQSFQKGDAITPDRKIQLEQPGEALSNRIIDIVTPIGKGQRAIIAAPPRSGKTILLENMIKSVSTHQDDLECFVLLVDERPEEVTHFKRLFPNTHVMASSNDEMQEHHIRLARQVFGVAKSMVEMGKDVIIFLDSLTRLCRAFNSQQRGRRTLSGGLDSNALVEPKKMFGMARQIENSGSLTIIATALIETDSQMDEVIFREFKGTGNMEIVLDRTLADKQIYPAINIKVSGTRNEDKLHGPETNEQINSLRRALSDSGNEEAMRQLIHLAEKYPTNEEFLKLQS
ncbi:MAG: transcription termination factor Rho [Lentisphaeraceae bacterium]|nr:transcription termination factor Rho [Lentisphaeraceae bacterium]